MSERRGALALVLHTHMPYVEGFGTWPFGEEWLWEAVACVYLPLLEVLDGAPVTVGLTPVLCDQLEAMRGEPGDRYLRFLREVRAEVHAEDSAGLDRGGEHELAAEVRRAAGDYERAADEFERRGRDLLAALGALRGVELWTSAATHAVLPMLATDAGLDLQLATGIASHRRRFGGWDGGFWLPECAYSPDLDAALERHGVRRFCVDQTTAHGVGAPEHLEPVRAGLGRAGGARGLADGRADLERARGLSRPPGLPRLPPAHGPRPAALGELRRALRPRGRPRARPRARARLPAPRRGARARAAGSCAARSTPSCSGTGGTRGPSGSRPCWPRRRPRAWSW